MPDFLMCRQLCKVYNDGNNQTSVLNNVSFKINAGEQVAILGSSGSGKSSLLHILGGLDSPTSGEVVFKGQTVTAMTKSQLAHMRNRDIGFVYQFHHLLDEFTALENTAMPLRIRGESTTKSNALAMTMLEQVGLSHRALHLPAQLSGGERQRVAIARALVTEPALVLADEPTGNLDHKTGESIYQLMAALNKQHNTSFVVVTHDTGLAKKMDRTLLLRDGVLHDEEVSS